MTREAFRSATQASGGLTPAERDKIGSLIRLWSSRFSRTDPVEPTKIVPPIEGIYKAAGLKRPWIAVASSPLALAFAYGAAAAAWHDGNRRQALEMVLRRTTQVLACREGGEEVAPAASGAESVSSIHDQILDLTEDETHLAVGSDRCTGFNGREYFINSLLYQEVENSGLRSLRWPDRRSWIRAVAAITSRRISVRQAQALWQTLAGSANVPRLRNEWFSADHAAARARNRRSSQDDGLLQELSLEQIEMLAAHSCHQVAGRSGLLAAKRWRHVLRGNDIEFPGLARLAAFRDVLGLELPSHKSFAYLEQAVLESTLRVMHSEFCIVCDFPEVLKLDEQNRPHCADGPSHRWRDGWALYHWHGTLVPEAWIKDKARLTAACALRIHNTELRRAALEIVGWHNVLRELNGRVVTQDPDPERGRLIDVNLPGLRSPARFLHVRCATGREFAVGIPRRYRTVKGAHAWLTGLPTRKFKFPTRRT